MVGKAIHPDDTRKHNCNMNEVPKWRVVLYLGLYCFSIPLIASAIGYAGGWMSAKILNFLHLVKEEQNQMISWGFSIGMAVATGPLVFMKAVRCISVLRTRVR
jgi:hypothetical protein